MLKLKKAAVTGGVSCGKSQFCTYLEELGAYVVSADNIVHQLLSPETNLGKRVINLLGPEILTDNQINRKAIANKVFNNPQLLQALEQIIHPEVFLEINKEYEKAKKQHAKLFVAEIPLLFEVGAEGLFDATIAVIANKKQCLERFIENEASYNGRMSRQLSSEEKAERANYVIPNNGSLEDLRVEAKKTFIKITN